MVNIVVDNLQIQATPEQNLLQCCLENGIYIPHLCHIDGIKHPFASCRLCFVEIEGQNNPVASCTVLVSEGMVVQTDTPAVRTLQKTALRLLLSVHDVNCKPCPANKRCELQKMAKFLKVGLIVKDLEKRLKPTIVDISHPCFDLFPNRCVLCGKCIHVCLTRHGQSLLTFAWRGLDTVLTTFFVPGQNDISCTDCTACVDVCPVAAIIPKKDGSQIG